MPKLKVKRSLPARLRGLLLTRQSDDLVLLVPCKDVHTVGMSYAIDLAFFDEYGVVLKTYRAVEPGCRLRCAQAFAAAERASAPEDDWFTPGSCTKGPVRRALIERKRS